MPFTAIIPARYASTRFPGKPLTLIKGKPMIQHVYERCVEANAQRVVVATDSQQIAETVAAFGGQYCMTSKHHESGTSRIAEVLNQLSIDDNEVIVNVQGDEPFIPAANIQQVANNLMLFSQAKMTTLCEPIIALDDMLNPNVVKVVADKHNFALYFSRAPIPFERDSIAQDEMPLNYTHGYRHIGLYGYRAGFIREYLAMTATSLEHIEKLEQLRVLWHGHKIHIEQAKEPGPIGIDTPEDLARINQAS